MQRKFLFLPALLLVLLGGVLGWAGAAPYWQEAPPATVTESFPFAGEELALDQAVSFYFDQAMDRASVEAAFSLEPASAFTLSWADDQTLTVSPDPAWERGTALTFRIADSAMTQAGSPLAEPYEASFPTLGYLEVVEVLPEDGQQGVAADTPITVIFNRPVVPLLALEEQADLPNPLQIDPPLVGEGEWLNSSIYIFRPTNGLLGGVDHTITVAAGFTAADGAILAEDYTWTFATLLPSVLEVSPAPESSLTPLDTTVSISFSQAMNPSATDEAIQIMHQASESPVMGTITWNEGNTVAEFEPDVPLLLDSLYSVNVDATSARSASGAPLEASWNSTFSTVPAPAIVSTSPADGESGADPYGGINIYFNTPIDRDSLEDKIIIEPEPWRDYDTYYYDYDNRYSLFFDTEPSTDYTITILPGIADPYGNTIDSETVIQYSTRAYDPALNLNTPDLVGLYSAYNPNTRVFATHRNVSQLQMQLYGVDSATLAQILGFNGYEFRQQWQPSELLRNWTIDVQSPLNQRRYELLLLTDAAAGDGIQNLECLGAPAPRMLLGAEGFVTEDDPRPLRVRAEPNLSGAVITQIDPGVGFSVIGGPICADGFIWWQINVEGTEGWSAEGTLEGYFMAPLSSSPTPEQQSPAEEVDPADFPALAPGIYYLSMSSPETNREGYGNIEHFAIVATASIQLKFSPDQVLAWVTDLESGEPLANVPVNFYNENFEPLGSLQTNSEGVALLEIPRLQDLYTMLFATVESADHFAFASSNFDLGLDPWRFGINGNYTPEDLTVYLYSDRPIYRPDQPVYFRGAVRAQDDVQFTLPLGIEEVPVAVYDPENQVVYQDVLPLSAYGTFSGSFELDPEAALGYYRLVAMVSSVQRSEFNMSFNVAEYSAPEFQVTLSPTLDEVAQGTDIEVLVDSRYFFGGAVSNAAVEWTALTRDYAFNYQGSGNYSFIDFNYDAGPGEFYGSFGEPVADGVGTTDAQGRFMISLPTDLGTRTQSQEYTIEARITDESDQLVAGRIQVVVHQGEVYLGIAPEAYINSAGQEALVNLISVDWASDPVAGQDVDYRIVERRWSSVQEEDELGRTIWTWEVEELPIEEGSVSTGEDGRAQIAFTPPNGGVYKIYGETRDSQGNTVMSSAFMWVAGRDYVAWRQENSNTFDLITDADEYAVGDSAEILIASPFQGEAVALITVERGGILSHDVVRMDTNSYVYELPITAEHAPNIFVSVIIVKGVDENNPYAEFRMGMAQLTVDTEQFALNIEVMPNVDMAAGEFVGPGDEVSYSIRTTDHQGNPVSAELGIGVTDLSVLTIAPPNSISLMEHFYSQRGISVRTSTPLVVSVDKATQTIIDTVKGGGGGGSELGIFDIREEFVDTPGWEPNLVTDENGEATYTLTLPDNLTTWRLDARGLTRGADGQPMLVGQTLSDVLSTKPLLIRPQTPRFLIVDDVVQFAAIVNNNTGETQTVEVTLQGTGFALENEATPLSQTVEIAAGARQRINWDVRVQDVPHIDLTFFANGNEGQYTDASKPTLGQGPERLLPVYQYEVPETVGTGGALYEGGSRSELISLPRRFDVTQGTLTVELDRSLAAPALDGLDYLENFPHQCTEQTVSRFLPNVMTLRAFRELGLEDAALEARLDVAVNFALQRLYAQQKPDGGWGWFPQNDSSALVTAYALIGLVEARNSGYSLDQNVINRAADFVQENINNLSPNPSRYQLNRQAFLVYAAARAGFFQQSAAANLYEQRLLLNTDAKAFLVMALHLMDANDPRISNLLSDFSSTAVLSATGAHWEDEHDPWNWTTDTRSTALVLQAFVQTSPDSQLIPQIVRWLMVARQADAWETTQETAWAVMALTDWMAASGELDADYNFGVGLNGTALPLADDSATRENVAESETLRIEVAELLSDEANRLTLTRSEGPGNLYYSAHLEIYLPVAEVEPVSQGLTINRRYYAFNDDSGRPITEGRVGDQVEVVLTIIAPNSLNYVVVEDPIPAGSAAVDPGLLTSSVVSQGPEINRTDPLAYGWGWWYFSRTEFRDEKVVLYADYLPRGTYEFRYTIRLGLPGSFNVIPPTAQEFYFPEVYGRGAGSLFTILPAEEPAP